MFRMIVDTYLEGLVIKLNQLAEINPKLASIMVRWSAATK